MEALQYIFQFLYPIQHEYYGNQVGKLHQLIFAVTVDVNKEIAEIYQVISKKLMAVQSFLKVKRNCPAILAVIQDNRDYCRQAEVFSLCFSPRNID